MPKWLLSIDIPRCVASVCLGVMDYFFLGPMTWSVRVPKLRVENRPNGTGRCLYQGRCHLD